MCRCAGSKMADDLDIEAMLEAPYKKVRVCLSFAHETVSRTLLLHPLLLTCRVLQSNWSHSELENEQNYVSSKFICNSSFTYWQR